MQYMYINNGLFQKQVDYDFPNHAARWVNIKQMIFSSLALFKGLKFDFKRFWGWNVNKSAFIGRAKSFIPLVI